LGGAPINPDGSWAGGTQAVLPATNGQLTLVVSPITAVLLNPVVLPTAGTNIMFSLTGNLLTLSWPSNYTGWLLQSNAVSLATTSAWFTVPGSASTNSLQFPVDPALLNVFYRMVHL
jgi:hypothetical protein